MAARFWKEWIYDSARLPIEWQTHPHDAFKIGSRAAFVFAGSLVPFFLILLRSGILRRLDEGTVQLGWVFWGTAALFLAVWAASVILAVAAEEKSLAKYLALGLIGPPNAYLLLELTRSIE